MPPLARLLLVALCVSCGAARAQAPATPVELVLEDQFKNRHETARLRGDVVVLVYAERHGAEAAVDLGRRLHVRFHPTAATAPPEEWATQPVVTPAGWPAGVRVPDVHVVPVACVPGVPRPLQAVARTRLRKESPHLSVWLDFDDGLKQSFGMVEGAPNTVIVDPAGLPRGVVPGVPDDRRFEELVGFIEGLRVAPPAGSRLATLPPTPALPLAPTPASAIVPTGAVR